MSMTKYKVGDRVVVKSPKDLRLHTYSNFSLYDRSEHSPYYRLCGKIVTIATARRRQEFNHRNGSMREYSSYTVEELRNAVDDPNKPPAFHNLWCDDSFEGLAPALNINPEAIDMVL